MATRCSCCHLLPATDPNLRLETPRLPRPSWFAERIYPYEGFEEQAVYGFDDMLRAFDESMPEGERLGDFLDSEEVPASELSLDDRVWMQGIDGRYSLYPVVVFMDDGTPLVGRYDHDGDWSWNPNNRVTAETIRIAPRG